MSLQLTKNHLIELLADSDNKVIALSGKWGTGKSHLWAETQKTSTDEKIKGAIYASLFGLSSIDQIKKKLIAMTLPGVETRSTWWKNTKQVASTSVKVLEGIHPSFGALNDFSLILAPKMLKEKVIVLDDIERKHANLHSDEVMGFIDEFSQQHGVRFILILNNDQLTDKDLWDTLREKVIDQELLLETTPTEAFQIAEQIIPTHYVEKIKSTIEVCSISNIRIICKVLKAVNRILSNRTDLSDDILLRVVPSTVLLAATHYKGIEKGPDLEFILKIGSSDDRATLAKKEDQLDDIEKQHAEWRILLQQLRIYNCDEYEEVVVSFLKSGLFDTSNVEKIIHRYSNEVDAMHADALVGKLYDYFYWHPKTTETELIAKATEVTHQSHLLDAYAATDLYKLISELPGGSELADSMINNWIEKFKVKNIDNFEHDNFFNRPIHLKIQTAFDEMKYRSLVHYSVFDACKHIVKHSSWGEKQELTLKKATVTDFETTIRKLEGEDLRLFMLQFVKMSVSSNNHSKQFGSATENFISACQNISRNPNEVRLNQIIKRLFESSKLEYHLAT